MTGVMNQPGNSRHQDSLEKWLMFRTKSEEGGQEKERYDLLRQYNMTFRSTIPGPGGKRGEGLRKETVDLGFGKREVVGEPLLAVPEG
jgi:hypothetical protein